MFSLDLKGTQERDNHRCKGCVELSMREVSKKAGAKEMAEQKEHSVFHHTLRFLLLKKQVLAGNCPRAGITDTRSSTASYRCAPKKKKKAYINACACSAPPFLIDSESHWCRWWLFPKQCQWMDHHSSTTEPVTLTARSANKEEHAHLDIRAKDFWNASQDCSLVIVSMDNHGPWCGRWWECLYPRSSSPANALYKRVTGLLHHLDHLLRASVAADYHYPRRHNEEVWTMVWRDPYWR